MLIIKRFFIVVLSFVVCYNCYSQTYKWPLIKRDTSFLKGVERTAWLLTSGSAQQKKEVRILVYGQSISVQDWWKSVQPFFEKNYPAAQIIVANKAIGGFSTERLKLMVHNDVVSFYPDLILFHDYGNEEDYETIITTIRKNTVAEIAVQTDHMAVQSQEWHDRHSQVWLKDLCNRYGLAYLDVRASWKQFLKENNLKIENLLSDGVHLNKEGNALMAHIITQHFQSLTSSLKKDKYVRTLQAGKDFKAKGQTITVPFNGNKVTVSGSTSNNAMVNVLLDGKKPSDCLPCYYPTRPSIDANPFALRSIGQLLRADLGNGAKAENWNLTVTGFDSVKQIIQYTIKGSQTGNDGEGSSDVTFKSTSGKIQIEPQFWFIRRNSGDFSQFHWLQNGNVLQWQVQSMCVDHFAVKKEPTTIISGIQNKQHLLKLQGKNVAGIKEIKIYQPPLQD